MVHTRRANPVSNCPLNGRYRRGSGKWKMIIVYSLAECPYHFAAIREFLRIVSKVLASN